MFKGSILNSVYLLAVNRQKTERQYLFIKVYFAPELTLRYSSVNIPDS